MLKLLPSINRARRGKSCHWSVVIACMNIYISIRKIYLAMIERILNSFRHLNGVQNLYIFGSNVVGYSWELFVFLVAISLAMQLGSIVSLTWGMQIYFGSILAFTVTLIVSAGGFVLNYCSLADIFIWPIGDEHNANWPIRLLLYLPTLAYHKHHTISSFKIFFDNLFHYGLKLYVSWSAQWSTTRFFLYDSWKSQ